MAKNNIYSMDRLTFIAQFDPLWALMIRDFVDLNPIFKKYLELAPSTRKPLLNLKWRTPNDILRWYVCHTGVRNSYGDELYKYVETGGREESKLKKKTTTINDIDELDKITCIEDVENINIKGVGIGAKNFIKRYVYDDFGVVDYTDRIFLKGICKLYDKEKLTPTQAKKISDEWKGNFKGIGSAFCFQIAHYA